MQTLNIEETSSPTRSNMQKVTTFAREGQVLFFAYAASLGFLSMGFHLSVFNSISVFLWQGDPSETNYYTFKTVSDAILSLSVFAIAGVLSCNKIKFQHYKKLLIVADAFMILGTLTSFSIFSPHVNWLYIGRFIVGEAIALNLAIIPPFVREAQFYLSESNFKTEKRRFFIDILFALGVFLGFTPSQLLTQVAEHDVYIEDNYDYENLTYMQRPDLFSCYMLCFIPIAASIGRVVLFIYVGDVKPPQYAPAFNDEGLGDAFEEEEDAGRLYMLKFKETKSLIKLLQEPYRRRMELCYILYFLQVISGFVIFIVNPALLVTFFQQREFEILNGEEVQFTVLEFGAIYLLTTLVISFLFAMTKIKRKLVMTAGNVLATVTALGLAGSSLLGYTDHLKLLLLVYWFASCLGLGTAMETFVEEVIPAKGLQFLLSIKFLLVCVIGVITSYSLAYHFTYIPLYLFLFVIGLMALFVIFDLTPETADVDPRDIYKLFEFEGEGEEESREKSTTQIGDDNMNSTVAST